MSNLNVKYEELGIVLDHNNSCHPGIDGAPRWGRIRKEMIISSPSNWGTGKSSLVGLEVNTWEEEITVEYLKGTMPFMEKLFLALLADRDIRRLIKKYQENKKNPPFKLWTKEGQSGCEDHFMSIYNRRGGFYFVECHKLLHVSCYGRLNEGFGRTIKEGRDITPRPHTLKVWEFVELVSYLGLTQDMNVKSLRKKAGVKYIFPQLREMEKYFTTEVSKIL